MASDQKNTLKRVGENLYVNGHGTYFAWFSKGGKQIKLSPKTQDKALARRRLADKRESAATLRSTVDRSLRFEELAKLWLESIKSEVKASTHSRRQGCVKQITPFFKGVPVKSIRLPLIENWKIARGGQDSPQNL